ncbi:MAG TPA: hypothetical protein VFT53_03805 [Candidatus Saccharimonadales bacterium]|nr:hypothetical protein [Candidatus Saccharimonadales bacterium]
MHGYEVAALCALLFVTFCFVFVLLFGAPFLPTLRPQIHTALDMLDLQPGQTMLELGCGDGRVLVAAAKRGWKVVGYELNPILAFVSWFVTRRYRSQVRVVWGDFWRVPWPEAQGVFGFILPRYMGKLHKKVMQYTYRPIRVASFAFTIPQKKPAQVRRGVYLYEYK